MYTDEKCQMYIDIQQVTHITHDPGCFSAASPTKMRQEISLTKQLLLNTKHFQIITLNLVTLTFFPTLPVFCQQTKHNTSLPEQDTTLKIPTKLNSQL